MRCKSSNKLMVKHKKGLWSPDEDQKLSTYIINYGHACWSSVPIHAGLQRSGKSCRLRWINYLRPGLKRGPFSLHEEEIILTLHSSLGNKWSQISQHLLGRTDNEIKNYWHTRLKKKLSKSEHLPHDPKLTNSNVTCTNPCRKTIPNLTKTNIDHSIAPVLFADWISLDEFQQDIVNSSNQPLSHTSNNYPSKTVGQGQESQHNEGSTADSSETRNCLESASNEDMFQTRMTIDDQIFEFDLGDFSIDDFI